ncbi:MAG TPA: nucleotidyl transferase AbiEii/AbiGii toxin family protein [Candidatus Thermoplasmatota archaeon]|nr:nucleotidyl transferase AbiEii/AbiGii toxin family protein [Candidatus Thermoplasmatota archaeon]
MAPDPGARERAVAELLDRWPWELGGVIIGGYAIAAYGKPRYSTDIDVVIKIEAFEALDKWLLSEGFTRGPIPEDLEQNYAGKGFQYVRENVTIDVLPGVVRDREAGVNVPERWITKDALTTRLFLLESATKTEVPVCRLEAFVALKIQAGREKDLSDLFVLRDEKINAKEIQEMFQSLRTSTLEAKLRLVLKRLDDEKIFNDSMARLGLNRRGKLDRGAEWAKFKAKMRAIIEPILTA